MRHEGIDLVAQSIEAANELLTRPALGAELDEWLARLESFTPRDLVRFDERGRAPYSGIRWVQITGYADSNATTRIWHRLRDLMNKGSGLAGAERDMTSVLALVSPNGHHREYAIRVTALRPIVVRLIALRCIDWVPEVRAAAVDRLADCPPSELLEALPLVEQLARERARGEILSTFLGTRLSDDDLRHAYRSAERSIRRAAWR